MSRAVRPGRGRNVQGQQGREPGVDLDNDPPVGGHHPGEESQSEEDFAGFEGFPEMGDGRRQRERWRRREAELLAKLRADIQVSQVSATGALSGIPRLRDKDYEIWLTAVGDAFYGAGLYPLFKVSAVREDALAAQDDLRKCAALNAGTVSLAWSALKKSIGPDTSAYALTLTVTMGDVTALLRVIRKNYEKSSVAEQHRLLSQLRRTNQADHKTVKSYVSALETLFVKLAKIGKVLEDDDKRYYLMEGLTEDFRRGVSGNIYAYETPEGNAADYAKAVHILTVWEDGRVLSGREIHRDVAMSTAAKVNKKDRTCKGYARKGQCRFGSNCRFLHVDAPVGANPDKGLQKRQKIAQRPTSDGPKPKKTAFKGPCYKCGRQGHRKRDCPGDEARTAVDLVASTRDNVSMLAGPWGNPRVDDHEWISRDFDEDAKAELWLQLPAPGKRGEHQVDFAFPVAPTTGLTQHAWMVDGGSTCHVLGFVGAYEAFIFNRCPAIVGGGGESDVQRGRRFVCAFVV